MVKENGMVMLTETELKGMQADHERAMHECEKRIEFLQSALLQATTGNKAVEGVRVTKTDFLQIYDKALQAMFKAEEDGTLDPDNNDIYGYDFTIHWHGIYCNCYDGAIPSNHIIPAIEGVNDEDPDEGWC